MNRIVLILSFMIGLFSNAQNLQAPPQGINYQAVVYDLDGGNMPGVDAGDVVLANKDIGVRFSINKNHPYGQTIYKEVHYTTTDKYGMFNLVIGMGNSNIGTFSSIDWGAGTYFLKVEVAKDLNNDFVEISNAQFWSVPYALYAKGSHDGVQTISDNGDGSITITYTDSTQVIGPSSWALKGNAGTQDTVNFLGTKDAQDLVIKTDLAERMRVTKLGQVGVGTPTPHPSALVDVSSTQKGFLPPRMTAAQRNSIANPSSGLIVFNTTDSVTEYFNGQCWLPTYLSSCSDCMFDLTLAVDTGHIDRVTTDTIAIQISVNQTTSPAQVISFFAIHNLPQFTTTYFTNDTLQGNGNTTLVVTTSIFDDPGMYPIAIEAICGNTIRVKVFYLTIDSCYHVTINSPQVNYNLQQVNSLPGIGTPICVVVDVTSLGVISSSIPTIPTFNSGNLDPTSHVGIRNYGVFLAKGGNGGLGGNLSQFGNPGQAGGTAINMTSKTSVLNYGFIYGGGGGGASVGVSTSFSVPFLGTYTFAIGAGGGGGCQLGLGGGSGSTVIGIWDNGNNATGGLSAVPGSGGVENVPVSLPLGPVTLTINPDVHGGDGGNYGLPGDAGYLIVNVSATIPIVGTINIPTPTISSFPAGGAAGYAIKKNNRPLFGYPNGTYQLSNLKGIVND